MRWIVFCIIPLLAGCLSGLTATETSAPEESPAATYTFKPIIPTEENAERLSLLEISPGEPIPVYSMLSGQDNAWQVEARLIFCSVIPAPSLVRLTSPGHHQSPALKDPSVPAIRSWSYGGPL